MRRLIFILFILISIPLWALSLYSDGSSGRVSGEDFSISLYDGSLYLKAGPLSYGAIGKRGLFRFLSSPHRASWDLEPAVTMQGYSSSSQAGIVVTGGPLSIGYSTDGRQAVAASLTGTYLQGALLFASGEGSDGSLQKKAGTDTEYDTLYLALTGGYSWLSLLGVLSFVPEYGLLPLAGVRVGYEDYSFSFTYGDIFDLKSSDTSFTWGTVITIGEEGFLASFSYAEGLAPVYADEHLVRSASIDVSLELSEVILVSTMDYSCSKTGNETNTNKFKLKTDVLSLGWSDDDGLFWEWVFKSFAVGLEDGEMYVKISLVFGNPDMNVRIKLSSGAAVSVGLSWYT